MKTKRFARTSSRLPRRGNVLVTITVVDENGFTSQYETVETPVGALRDGVAAIHLAAVTPAAGAQAERSA
jgi:predicted phage tail protein